MGTVEDTEGLVAEVLYFLKCFIPTNLQLFFRFLSVWRSLFSAFAAAESIIESRNTALEQESGRKGMLGESTILLLQLDGGHPILSDVELC